MDISKYKIIPKPETAKRLTMSDAEYFGNALTGYVSNSQLSLLNPAQGGSYAKFLAGFDDSNMNANSLELGSAVHALFLEAHSYRLSDYTKPSGKVGPIIYDTYNLIKNGDKREFDVILKECALNNDYYSNSLTEKRILTLKEKGVPYFNYLQGVVKTDDVTEIVLSEDMRNKCSTIIKNLNADPSIMLKFFPEDLLGEVKVYYEDVITMDIDVELEPGIIQTIKLKGKIDQWSIDYENKAISINDLKTTGKECKYFAGFEFDDFVTGEKRFVNGSFQNFHYHRQVAMYSWMIWHYTQEIRKNDKAWTMNSNIGVVETIGEHNTLLLPVSKTTVMSGYKEFDTLIKTLAHYMYYGDDV